MHIYIKFNFIWRNENQKSKSDISEWKNTGQINREREKEKCECKRMKHETDKRYVVNEKDLKFNNLFN